MMLPPPIGHAYGAYKYNMYSHRDLDYYTKYDACHTFNDKYIFGF